MIRETTGLRAFIFDEPGTGKTKRSIDLLGNVAHVLVACPASVVRTAWLPQLAEYDPGNTAITVDDYKTGGWPDDVKWLVCSYNQLDKIRETPDRFSLVLDESHYVKSTRSNRHSRCRNLSQYARNVLMMTGTPAPRDLEDLYGQTCVLYPNAKERARKLGEEWKTLGRFRAHYGKGRTMWLRGMPVTKWEYDEQHVNACTAALADLVLPYRNNPLSLPTPKWVPVITSDEERQALEDWKRSGVLNDDVYAKDATMLAGKLGQLDDGFAYHTDDEGHDIFNPNGIPSKIEALEGLLGDDPLLVWSRYKVIPGLVKERYGNLAIDVKDYMALPQQARRPYRLVMANPASSGTGVDGLQHMMHRQVWLDLPWTYAEYAQAERRLVRRGTPWPDREQHVYIMDTPYQRRLYEVVVGRKRLDEIIKEECGEQE